MTDRTELIEAGKQALADAWSRGVLLSQGVPGGMWVKDFGKFTATVLDAVEEKIRADEQKQYDRAMFSDYHRDWDAKMADLRAKVEALLEQAKRERDRLPRVLMRDDPYGYGNGMHAGGKVAGIAEVLYGPLDGAAMPRFPVCQLCAAMLPDESVEQKHYDWHAALARRLARTDQQEPPVNRDHFTMADMRAKVLALPYVLTYGTAEVKRDDVLNLLDGDSE